MVVNWANINCMPLDYNKMKHMVLTHQTAYNIYNYYTDQTRNETVTSMKGLGVIIDTKLYFHEFINRITAKSGWDLGLILWICNKFKNINTSNILYKSVLRCHLEYDTVMRNSERLIIIEQWNLQNNRLLIRAAEKPLSPA